MNPLVVLSNPRRRRKKSAHRRRRAAATPRRRRRKSAVARVFKLHRNPRRRRHRHMRTRRNPSSRRGFSLGGASVTSMLMPGALGAVGALGLDYAYSKASPYLPSFLQGNYYASAALKLGVAFAVAKLGRKVVKPQTAVALGAGIAVVTLYDVGQILMGTLVSPPAPAAAGTPVSGLGYIATGANAGPGISPNARFGVGERLGERLGHYNGVDNYGYGYGYN